MRKTAAALATLALLVVGLSFLPQGAGAQTTPEINLDLTIDPTQGPPGTVINTSVPPEQVLDVCLDGNAFAGELIALANQLLTDPATLDPDLIALLTALAATPPETLAASLDVAFLYVLAFADIATQQPVPGSDQPFWDPITGEGQITAPEAPFGTYAVAAVCLDLKAIEDLDPAALAEALAGTAFDPTDIEGTLADGLAGLIPLLLDTENPRGTGVALFCLGDEAFCAAEGAPEGPVAAEPGFTG